jgi:hypothetical protein
MPSSFSFLLNSQSNNSSSSDSDDQPVRLKKRTMTSKSDLLERPSDLEQSGSQSDGTDEDDEKKIDLFTPSINASSTCSTRPVILSDDDWPSKANCDAKQFSATIEDNLSKPTDIASLKTFNFYSSRQPHVSADTRREN